MRAGLIGSVQTSAIALEAIGDSDLELVGVLGFEPKDVSKVSGFVNLREGAANAGAQYIPFEKVSDPEVVEILRNWDLDYLFVVGMSQLISEDVIGTARIGCIGYHPTLLPKGRGRAPLAWVVLGMAPGASTLFEIAPGADTGGVLEQVQWSVGRRGDARDAMDACSASLREALSSLLPRLGRGEWEPVAQDEQLATTLGKRVPADGLVDWTASSEDVDILIRAATSPHPGAYCYSAGRRVFVMRSMGPVPPWRHQGVVGKVVHVDDDGSYRVQCGRGVVRIGNVVDEDGTPVTLREGSMLRTRVEDELHALRDKYDAMEKVVVSLHERVGSLEREHCPERGSDSTNGATFE